MQPCAVHQKPGRLEFASRSEKCGQALAKRTFNPFFAGSWADFQGNDLSLTRFGISDLRAEIFKFKKSKLFSGTRDLKICLLLIFCSRETVQA